MVLKLWNLPICPILQKLRVWKIAFFEEKIGHLWMFPYVENKEENHIYFPINMYSRCVSIDYNLGFGLIDPQQQIIDAFQCCGKMILDLRDSNKNISSRKIEKSHIGENYEEILN